MSLREPMTLATDYVLFIAALLFCVRLWRASRSWSLAFLFTAAGSFFGGTFHGFAPVLSPLTGAALWKATVLSIGLASFFLLAGSGRVLTIIAVVKSVVYASWMITHDDFIWVIADYGVTLLLVAVSQAVAWSRWRSPSAPWFIGSVVVSIVAAIVQASRIRLHPNFNHNDLFHVIQLAALWMLFRAGVTMSATTRRTSPPT